MSSASTCELSVSPSLARQQLYHLDDFGQRQDLFEGQARNVSSSGVSYRERGQRLGNYSQVSSREAPPALQSQRGAGPDPLPLLLGHSADSRGTCVVPFCVAGAAQRPL